jgi:hypothetical protein
MNGGEFLYITKKCLSLLLALFLCIIIFTAPTAQCQDSSGTTTAVKRNLETCYDAVLHAETASANISSLIVILNDASELLSKAELANAAGDYAVANSYASQSQNVLNGFAEKASTLQQAAITENSQHSTSMILTLFVSLIVFLCGLSAWFILNRQKMNLTHGALHQYKTSILIVMTAVSLLVASPALQPLLVYPQTDNLTEFYMFGPNCDTEYPSNIIANQNFRLYLGITNYLDSSAYYIIQLKFRDQTQSAPSSFNHTSSNLPSLSDLTIFVAKDSTEELPLDISFQYTISEDLTLLSMHNITVNGFSLDANDTTIAWDEEKTGFYGNIFFELWIYNTSTNSFQYHERYLSLWLKMNP